MATRANCTEWSFGTNAANLANTTRYDFTAITLYSPETTSRTFTSVFLEIYARDNSSATTSRASLSSWLIGIKLGSVAFDDVTVTDTMTDTGEQVSYIFSRDVTSYFNTNFGTGASQTCQVGFQFGTSSATNPPILGNLTAKLVMSYEYDDSSGTTRIKTIRVPLESNTAGLGTGLASIGTNQVPALDTFCPEDSKTYRQIFFEISGNEGNTGTTDGNIAVALDSESEVAFGLNEGANTSACYNFYLWNRNDITTNAVHDFKARTTSTTYGAFNNLCVLLVVNYEYSTSTTTSYLNSLMFPWNVSLPLMGTSTAEAYRFQIKNYFSEPGTLTLAQSGLYMSYHEASAANNIIRVGGQSYRTYTALAGTVTCGLQCLQHRFDSGSAQGAGVTLNSSGTETTITIDVYPATTNIATAVGGIIYLNYTSDFATAKEGVHSKTIRKLLRATAADATIENIAAIAVAAIPETTYWLYCAGLISTEITASASYSTFVECEIASTESQADGWRLLGGETTLGDAEIQPVKFHFATCSNWKRWPNDWDTSRLDIETSRRWRYVSDVTSWKSLQAFITYHAHTFTWSGTISGSGGGTVNITLHDSSTGEKLASGSRTGDGSYSLTFLDGRSMFSQAREDSTHIGRSDNGNPTRA